MLIAYWAAKGGAGASVLAAAHALVAADTSPVMVVDLAGDLPDVLGVERPEAGVAEWLAAGESVPADALDRISHPVAANVSLLARGVGPLASPRMPVLASLLRRHPLTVIVDAGSAPSAAREIIAHVADRSILVTRPCYLAIRHWMQSGLAPTEVAVIREKYRSLSDDDVANTVGAPVRTTLEIDPKVARAVDAGMLAARLPRSLRRAIEEAS